MNKKNTVKKCYIIIENLDTVAKWNTPPIKVTLFCLDRGCSTGNWVSRACCRGGNTRTGELARSLIFILFFYFCLLFTFFYHELAAGEEIQELGSLLDHSFLFILFFLFIIYLLLWRTGCRGGNTGTGSLTRSFSFCPELVSARILFKFSRWWLSMRQMATVTKAVTVADNDRFDWFVAPQCDPQWIHSGSTVDSQWIHNLNPAPTSNLHVKSFGRQSFHPYIKLLTCGRSTQLQSRTFNCKVGCPVVKQWKGWKVGGGCHWGKSRKDCHSDPQIHL